MNHSVLPFLYTNSRSIHNKIDEFHSTVSLLNPFVICIVESWLTKDFNNSTLKLNGYSIFRKDRKSRGGGILIAIKSPLEGNMLDIEEDIEILTVDIYYENTKMLRVIGAYNPNFNDKKYLKNFFRILQNNIVVQDNILLMGDFNMPDASNELHKNLNKKQYCIYNDFLNKSQPILQCVNFPTRGIHTLDLIFVRNHNDIINLKFAPPIGNSDHVVILGDFVIKQKIRISNTRPIYFKNFNMANYLLINEVLKPRVSVLLNAKYHPQRLWFEFKNLIENVIELYIPLSKY